MRFPLTWAESANRRELAAFDKGNRVGYQAGYAAAQEAYLRLFSSAIADRTGLIGQVEQVIGKETYEH